MNMNKLVLLAVLFLGNHLILADDAVLNKFIDDDRLNGAFVGVLIEDIVADSAIYSHNSDLKFSTASNLKLFTSAAAIELLGPDYRFITSFYVNGDISDKGELKGDLIIAGGGDPLISGRFRGTITEVLEFWADSLSAKGINKIKGDLVTDNTFFKSDALAPGWSQDDLTYWYACPISALSFNDNCVDLHVYPARKINEKCLITINPQTDYIKIINNTTTCGAGLDNTFDFYRYPGTNTVEFFGGIAIDDTDGVIDYVSVDKPNLYCAGVFKDVMAKNGIKVKGRVLDIGSNDLPSKYQYRNLVRLFAWRSEPMSLVISVINKNSQNFFAEQTLKTIGAEICGSGSFEASTKIVRDWLESIGITTGDISYNDGSGLSYMNLAKPSAIVKLLEYMYDSPNFEAYYESLAIPGVDRSVRHRMAGQTLAEKMRTKTGSIANTRTFAGYLTTRSGRLLAFSLMVNNHSVDDSEIDDWMDNFCGYIIDNY
jgi:D-alanyl-D-alanine carboxypeptidase/D-alanyl-D-alanine-endopeptidase (penicillin-binding protein 4)